jgi:5-methylcytosine-specific restriction endonuclease McrA
MKGEKMSREFDYGDSWMRIEDIYAQADESKPLTTKQRKAILERDNHTPQQRGYTEDRGWHKSHDPCPYDGKPCTSLQVHHIEPRRTGGQNTPKNLLTISECFHVGRCKDNRIK